MTYTFKNATPNKIESLIKRVQTNFLPVHQKREFKNIIFQAHRRKPANGLLNKRAIFFFVQDL